MPTLNSPLTPRERTAWGLVAAAALVQVALGWSPVTDRYTWALENVPVWIGIALFALTWRRFPLSLLVMSLLLVHAAILAVGGHWSYAEVPLGHWARDAFALSRNPYDRLGHVAQGFVPALLARELLLRKARLPRGAWLPFLSGALAVAFSACYELTEWAVALLSEQAAESFLGTQGDNWDTQWDMFLALLGAAASLTLLSRVHDRSMAALPGNGPHGSE